MKALRKFLDKQKPHFQPNRIFNREENSKNLNPLSMPLNLSFLFLTR